MGDTNEQDQQQLMRESLAEFIAVFIFVFSGCLCAASDPKEIFAIAMAVHPQLNLHLRALFLLMHFQQCLLSGLPDVGIDFELRMAGHP